MVKVINAPHTHRCTCSRCGATLEYNNSDIERDIDHDHVIHVTTYTYYITCPVCHADIVINQYFNEWD